MEIEMMVEEKSLGQCLNGLDSPRERESVSERNVDTESDTDTDTTTDTDIKTCCRVCTATEGQTQTGTHRETKVDSAALDCGRWNKPWTVAYTRLIPLVFFCGLAKDGCDAFRLGKMRTPLFIFDSNRKCRAAGSGRETGRGPSEMVQLGSKQGWTSWQEHSQQDDERGKDSGRLERRRKTFQTGGEGNWRRREEVGRGSERAMGEAEELETLKICPYHPTHHLSGEYVKSTGTGSTMTVANRRSRSDDGHPGISRSRRARRVSVTVGPPGPIHVWLCPASVCCAPG
eukprot:767686-Hanusia_phi.AAC.3